MTTVRRSNATFVSFKDSYPLLNKIAPLWSTFAQENNCKYCRTYLKDGAIHIIIKSSRFAPTKHHFTVRLRSDQALLITEPATWRGPLILDMTEKIKEWHNADIIHHVKFWGKDPEGDYIAIREHRNGSSASKIIY